MHLPTARSPERGEHHAWDDNAAPTAYNTRDDAHDDPSHANSSSAITMPSTNRSTRSRSGKFRRLSRRPVTLAATFLLALTAVIVPASTATATSVAACAGDFARTFSPAITSAPQTVTVTETSTYGTCVVGATASGSATVTLTLACIPAMAGPAMIETLTWNVATGASSTISWSAPTIVAQTVVFTGTVTAGRHAGDTATKVTSGVSYVGSVVGCLLGTPVTSTTGLVDSLLLTH